MHIQIDRLLTSTEKGELSLSKAFASFSGINPLLCNPYTEPVWQSAVAQFESIIRPAEDKVSGKLRQKFKNLHDVGSCQVLS